ncbi:hypothetical protein PanWU01x14_121040, partial [Parasponia andersonii]
LAHIHPRSTSTSFGTMPLLLLLPPHFAPPPRPQLTRQVDENEEIEDKNLGL